MLQIHIEPDDEYDYSCSDCEELYKDIERHHVDFYLLMDMVTGQLPYDADQWKDSLKTLNKFFEVSYPLAEPIMTFQNKAVEFTFDENFLQHANLF